MWLERAIESREVTLRSGDGLWLASPLGLSMFGTEPDFGHGVYLEFLSLVWLSLLPFS